MNSPRLGEATEDDIELGTCFPLRGLDWKFDGFVPAFDVDIPTFKAAAEAVEALARERLEGTGYFLVRIGRSPKGRSCFEQMNRKKIAVELIHRTAAAATNSIFRQRSTTRRVWFPQPHTRSYCWRGGEPGAIKREDLPMFARIRRHNSSMMPSRCCAVILVTG